MVNGENLPQNLANDSKGNTSKRADTVVNEPYYIKLDRLNTQQKSNSIITSDRHSYEYDYIFNLTL